MVQHMISESHPREAQLFQDIIYGLDDGVVVADLEGRFLLFNPAAESMLGMGARDMSPAEWTAAYGCYLRDGVTPFPPEKLPLARAIQGEEIVDELILIKNFRRPSGLWIAVSGKPLRDGGGVLWGGLVIFRDITEQIEAEEKLKSASLRLSAVVDNHETGILVESEKREIQLINSALCDLFGICSQPAELIGTDCSRAAEQAKDRFQDSDGFVRRIESLLERREPVTNEKLHLRDGRVLERDYVPVRSGQRYLGHVWQYRDITVREEALQRAKVIERLSAALEQTADSVVITDKQGRIEYVNPAFETITGYSRDEALGNTPRLLRSGRHDQEFYRNLWHEVLAGRPFRGTIVNRKKTGELYWSQQTITPLKDREGNITHFVAVLKDITELLEKKEQESQMRLAREVQQFFYNTAVSLPGFDIAGAAYPAHETGGDYFDFIDVPGGCLCIAIGDVSGHGIGSALVMATTRAYVRSFGTTIGDPGTILTRVNRALTADLQAGQYVTLLLCCLDPRRRTVSFAGAGHVPGFSLNPEGEVDAVLGSTGPPLGLFEDSQFSTDSLVLSSPGQTLLLFTDGITDSMPPDENRFGIQQAIEYVSSRRHEPAHRIVAGLYQALCGSLAGQPQRDDATSVILKVT